MLPGHERVVILELPNRWPFQKYLLKVIAYLFHLTFPPLLASSRTFNERDIDAPKSVCLVSSSLSSPKKLCEQAIKLRGLRSTPSWELYGVRKLAIRLLKQRLFLKEQKCLPMYVVPLTCFEILHDRLQLPIAKTESMIDSMRRKVSAPVVAAFMAGGVAGAVSRTVVSPLERLKILYQIQSGGRNEYKMSIWRALRKMYTEEGWRGFMRGNGTNCVRIIPYSAVQFSAYSIYKKVWLLAKGLVRICL